MSLTFKILVGLFLIGFLIVLFFLTTTYQKNIDKKYQIIDNSVEINRVFDHMTSNRGTLYLDFEDSSRLKVGSAMLNRNYSPDDFSSFLKEGDSIIKHLKSDTLLIIRNSKHYYFVLNKIIDKNINK
jgi:hypothetical protein